MVGAFLKSTREAKGLTVRDIAERTNLMRQLVEELENEDFHRVPAVIYGRGFVKLYGQALDLEPEKIALLQNDFSLLYSGAVQPAVKLKEEARTVRETVHEHRAPEPVPEKIRLRVDRVPEKVAPAVEPAVAVEEPVEVAPAVEPAAAVEKPEKIKPAPVEEPVEESVDEIAADTPELTGEVVAAETEEQSVEVEPEPEESECVEPDLANPVVEPETGERGDEEIDLFAHAKRLVAMRRGEAREGDAGLPEDVFAQPEEKPEEVEEDGVDALAEARERMKRGLETLGLRLKGVCISAGRGIAAALSPLVRILPRGRTVLICFGVVAVVTVLALAVRVLFAMTADNGSFEELTVSPPPPGFYID